jgi:glycosyltransferase involved in cell wall biosynthesis
MPGQSRPVLVFAWDQFGPYHMDRLEALAEQLAGRCDIVGIELVSRGEIYGWKPTGPGRRFRKITLFPDRERAEVSAWRHLTALLAACVTSGARHVFLCDFQLPQIFLAAVILRFLGRRVVVMQDSKFDDKPRRLSREIGKALLYLPYTAALVGSPRSKAYLDFLGRMPARTVVGYDGVSMERLVRLSGSAPAPDGMPHESRHFTVIARFVPQKNVAAVLAAYAAYCRGSTRRPRELHLCGTGPLEAELKERAAGLPGVRFRGYLQEEEIARALASSLALLLVSTEEPFGLVINEAIALGVPVIVSTNCGARDLLVRTGINGYVVEPDNIEGLARFMALLDRDAAEWRRLALNTRRFREAADAGVFVHGVEQVLAALGHPARRPKPEAPRGHETVATVLSPDKAEAPPG